jgi:hypothetical protein
MKIANRRLGEIVDKKIEIRVFEVRGCSLRTVLKTGSINLGVIYCFLNIV